MINSASVRSNIGKITPYALQKRIMIAILLAALLPLLLIGVLSYSSIYFILQNKVERGMQTALEQKVINLESVLSSLNYASRQLVFEESISAALHNYLSTQDTLQKSNIYKDIDSYLTLINYTNPQLGMMEYFLTNDQNMLSPFNYYTNRKIDVSLFPYLSDGHNFTFYGPHVSLYNQTESMVFSIVRSVGNFGDEAPISIYIETNYRVFMDIFDMEAFSMPVNHVLYDEMGNLLYQEGKIAKDSFVFSAESDMGWVLSIHIHPNEFYREIQSWLQIGLLITIICVLAALLISWGVWRMIYDPLRKLKNEIQKVAKSQFHEPINLPGTKEFDYLLMKFHNMKLIVVELLEEIEKRERNKRHLEVEKLMYQINPHFIHNTLNTVQWVAMLNNQDEIVKLIATFTRLLNYNLGKEGGIVRLREEVEVLKDYITLQQIRYNYKFHVDIHVDDQTLECRIPRFILQPLVENSLYHGFKNSDGIITVKAEMIGDNLLIQVADNGSGMTKHEIARLFNDDQVKRRSGLGIGLRFINNIVRVHYGEGHSLKVESEPDKGTAMSLLLPPLPDNDESFDETQYYGQKGEDMT